MYRIILGVPGTGMLCESSSQASWLPSFHNKVHRIPSNNSGPNFNSCLMYALNAYEKGYCTHLAMMHTDIAVVMEKRPCQECRGEGCGECDHLGTCEKDRWVDVLVEEMDKHKADFISVPMAIKDHRGVTSCGIGNPATRWNPWRRFCTNEFPNLPPTFCAEDVGYGDKYLIHSNALCLFDLRNPLWQEVDETGCLRAIFNFTERVFRENGKWVRVQDSEDWAFSRRLWELGAKTFITSRIKTTHHGAITYDNNGDWGTFKNGDEDTASQWRESDPLKEILCQTSISS